MKTAEILHIGIDEVGRGPIAGPLTLCAFCIPHQSKQKITQQLKKIGITDSKQISEPNREIFTKQMHQMKQDGHVQFVTVSFSAEKIDQYGMSKCLRKAVGQLLSRLSAVPEQAKIYLDGSLYAPERFVHQETIIKGDQKNVLIGAASVIAKVKRDAYMRKISAQYPEYGFEVHKGYGTKGHRNMVKKHGLCSEHRESFCRNLI